MTMQEMARLILGLKAVGLTAEEINNLMLYIESGDEKYLPRKKSESDPDKVES